MKEVLLERATAVVFLCESVVVRWQEEPLFWGVTALSPAVKVLLWNLVVENLVIRLQDCLELYAILLA